MQIQMVTFSEAKAGNAPGEWQDGASGGVVGDATGTARFIVVDGATGAYDPLRWVDQLVTSFGPAVPLGDRVLLHVRAGRLIATFPPLGPEDFGTLPDGVHTLRSSLDRMTERLLTGAGVLAAGDYLFAATDAMAHWILRAIGRDEKKRS